MKLSHLRRPAAATCAVGAIVLSSVALAGVSASAAGDRAGADRSADKGRVLLGKVSGVTSFTCTAGTFPSFDYDATITVNAYRATDEATHVDLVAKVSDMPGVIPVTLGEAAITDKLLLDLGGTARTLEGNGTTTITSREPIAVPDLAGTFTSAATNVSAAVTSFEYALPTFSMGGTCTPTAGSSLGTLTIETGPVPTPSPTASPTATTSPTASPTATATSDPTATETPSGEGVPAKGAVAFSCVLQPLNSDFDYDATVTIGGYREDPDDDVVLWAEMSDIPGISPVAIEGDMTVELEATVGGADATLAGASHVSAPAKAKVPVPRLAGEVAADEDELEVTVSAFMFEIVTTGLTVTAPCEADDVAIGTMKVGTEAPDETEDPDPTTAATDTTTTTTASGGTGTLPKTGGADALPVVVLWAGALTLLGAAALLCVPQVRRRAH
ncbi:MAG: hypothetical protein WBP61_18840 [Nocardioides sp.]